MILPLRKLHFLIVVLIFCITDFSTFAGFPFFKKDKANKYEDDHTTWVYPPFGHTWGVVRATQTHLTFFTLGKATFSNPQGICVVKRTANDDPDNDADDDEVTVYGVNSGENSIIYNKSMQSIGLYGYDEVGEERLNQPWDISALTNGLVFVTDSGNQRIVKLRTIDNTLVYDSSFGEDSLGQPLELPRGIEATTGGKVICADALTSRILIFDTTGTYINTIHSESQPVGLAAVDIHDRWTRPHQEYIVYTSNGGKKLTKVNFKGELISSIAIEEASGIAGVYCGHVEIDLFHNVIVSDSANAQLLKFSSELDFLDAWGMKGKGRAQFTGPTGIAIWRRYGQTFVAEQSGAHYLWVGTDIIGEPDLNVNQESQTVTLSTGLTEKTRITLELFLDDEVIRRKRTTRPPGNQRVIWNLTQPAYYLPQAIPGELRERVFLAHGNYVLRLMFKPTYSSSKVFEKVMETSIQIDDPNISGQRE
ncbi:hypothetical protein K8I28_09445 [bacterium]|nr:hypothetical protein [bacterium]